MKNLIIIAIAALIVGCSTQDNGNVEVSQKAAQAAPTKVSELPADMPPEAKASAAAAMGQAQAIQARNNDPARARAMQEMQRQKGQ